NGLWALGARRLDALNEGQYGKPPSKIAPIELGAGNVGVALAESYFGMGEGTDVVTMVALVDGRFTEVLSLRTGHTPASEAESERVAWSAKYVTVRRPKKPFYDLVVTRTTPDGAPLENAIDREGGKLLPRQVYR